MTTRVHKEIERRAFPGEFRVTGGEGETPRIVGYAAKFNAVSEEMYGFREVIAPGAFSAVLQADVRGLFNHDPNIVLGRSTAGTLLLEEDDVGLRYEILPPDTQFARDLMESMRRGDITQSSFAFSMRGGTEQWEEKTDGTVIRTLVKVGALYDVSPVTYPAYEDTESGVRSAKQVFEEHREEREKASPEAKAPDFFIERARLAMIEME